MTDTTIKQRLERLALLAEVSEGLSAVREDLAAVAWEIARRKAEFDRLREAAAAIPIRTYKGHDGIARCAQCLPVATDCPHIQLARVLGGNHAD